MNTEPIERTTKRSWGEWLAFMEAIEASHLDHPQIARKVEEELEGMALGLNNVGWWAQGITVAYEQHSGRRLPGQQADGSFALSVSKTVAVDNHEAMARWVQFAAQDMEVSQIVSSQPTTGGSAKRRSWRVKVADGSSLLFNSEARPDGKSTVIIRHMKLPSHEANVAAKERWAAVLERFIAAL